MFTESPLLRKISLLPRHDESVSRFLQPYYQKNDRLRRPQRVTIAASDDWGGREYNYMTRHRGDCGTNLLLNIERCTMSTTT